MAEKVRELMNIKFQLGEGHEISANLDKELLIDTSSPETIANQLQDSPSTMFYWGSAAETATVLHSKVQSEYDKWYSSVYSVVKDQMIEKYGKTATTESTVKYEIIKQYPEKIAEWDKTLALSKYRKVMLNLAKDCFSKKNDNLVNLLSYYKKLAGEGI
jgi:hypothetical protein